MSTDEALDSLSFGFTTSMPPIPQKQEKKPMSTDEALDTLSFGFTTSMAPIPQKLEKKVEDLAAIDALSAGFSKFAPPPPAPIKKAEEFKSAPVTKSPAPPVDKKAKVEKFADDFSLMSGLDSPLATKPKTDGVQVEVVPPGAKAAKEVKHLSLFSLLFVIKFTNFLTLNIYIYYIQISYCINRCYRVSIH
ncbi:unnamed protein product [Oncorhynchus mykiss]|uniref:Calpastatin n=1 Tax=Oncorhynchus mykiss TaxID=8022 RepID=A0A060X2M3_ONCMY|nr:unnamed protein product [Oncorhynchus mykiss]